MAHLDNCVKEIICGLEKYDNLTEDEKVRFIYLFLGKKISFSTKWVYSRHQIREEIYGRAGYIESFENSMSNEKWEMICRDIAYLINYIGQQVGINIEVYYEDSGYYNTLPHVYNKVIRKDGSSYYIDLYEDLYCIVMNMRTDYFGFKDSRIEKEFSRKQLEEMDYKFEYITRQKPYTDEYFYFLFNNISGLDSAKDGIEAVLKNPSPYKNLDIGFYERKMYIFSIIKPYIRNHKDYKEIDWQWLDLYYRDYCRDGFNIIPKEIISIKDGSDRTFYEFDSQEGNYHQISEKDFGEMLANGLCLSEVYKECGYAEYRWIDDLQSKYSSKGK